MKRKNIKVGMKVQVKDLSKQDRDEYPIITDEMLEYSNTIQTVVFIARFSEHIELEDICAYWHPKWLKKVKGE